jgi:glutaredoxin
MLKSWLEEKGFEYTNKMVDQDQAAMEEMMKVSEGHMGVPFTVLTRDDGSQVKIAGFDKPRFQQELKASE